MLDAHAFRRLQIAHNVAGEPPREVAAERQASTEKAHDVGAAEGADGVLQQLWIQPSQVVGRWKLTCIANSLWKVDRYSTRPMAPLSSRGRD